MSYKEKKKQEISEVQPYSVKIKWDTLLSYFMSSIKAKVAINLSQSLFYI